MANEPKKSWFMGTGDKVDSNKWDLGVINDELKKMKEQNTVGEQQRKEDVTMKNESVVRAENGVSVKLAMDMDNKLASQWVVVAKDGEPLFSVSADELLGKENGIDTSKVPEAVVNDILSPNYGQLIKENIKEEGVLATAKAMIGEKKYAELFAAFTKSAAMPEGLKKYQDEKAGKKDEKDEPKDEKEASTSALKTAGDELEKTIKNASARVKFYTLAGILSDIKKDASAYKNDIINKELRRRKRT